MRNCPMFIHALIGSPYWTWVFLGYSNRNINFLLKQSPLLFRKLRYGYCTLFFMCLLYFSSRGLRWVDWNFLCLDTPCRFVRGLCYRGWNFFLLCIPFLSARILCYITPFNGSKFLLYFYPQFKGLL